MPGSLFGQRLQSKLEGVMYMKCTHLGGWFELPDMSMSRSRDQDTECVPTPVFVSCLGQCVPPPPPTPEVTLLGLLAPSLGSARQPASTMLWKAGFLGDGWGRGRE